MKNEKSVQTLKPHVSLNVQNIENSVEFYQKLFGVSPIKLKSDYAKFDLQNPSLNFVLNQRNYSKGGGLSHLGIQVATTEDVLKTRQTWLDEGLTTLDEMNVSCCHAKQDKTWARDPDGNEWEVFVVLEDIENFDEVESCACSNKLEGHISAQANVAESCCAPNLTQISSSMPKHETCCEAN